MDREIIIVLGKTGQGKSVWSRKYIEPFKRKFVFDPLMDMKVEYMDEAGLLFKYDNGDFKPGKDFSIGIYNADYLSLLGSLGFLSGNSLITIEECAIAFPYGNHSVDEWLHEIVFLGRHRRVSLLLTAQRAVSIPIIVRSQATRIISFSQQEGADMRWLQDYFGSRANFIPNLPKLRCLDAYNGEVSEYSINYDGERQGIKEGHKEIGSYQESRKMPKNRSEDVEEFILQKDDD